MDGDDDDINEPEEPDERDQFVTLALQKKKSSVDPPVIARSITVNLSDKDKENSDSDDSFCTDISGESLLEGSSDEDLDENDKTLQNQILKNFVA